MKELRRYQRYVVSKDGDVPQTEVKVEGELVHLVNFSLGGVCILSKKPLPPNLVSVSVEFGNRGKIDLTGIVVRVEKEGDMWRIAIDFTRTYRLNSLKEV